MLWKNVCFQHQVKKLGGMYSAYPPEYILPQLSSNDRHTHRQLLITFSLGTRAVKEVNPRRNSESITRIKYLEGSSIRNAHFCILAHKELALVSGRVLYFQCMIILHVTLCDIMLDIYQHDSSCCIIHVFLLYWDSSMFTVYVLALHNEVGNAKLLA
jgi:hypothetical protein